MTRITWFSTAILAAALSAGTATAQDTHTIVRHYPDTFTVETTRTTDQDSTANGKRSTNHSQIVFRETAQRDGNLYHATLIVLSAQIDGQDADGKTTPQVEQQKRMMNLLVGLGPIQVTLDDKMVPQSIDNIEDLKSRIKQGLTASGDADADAMGVKLYDAFVANLTPQSAAAFLKPMAQAGHMFDQPLQLHVTKPIDGSSIQIMGGTLKQKGTVTLDSWDDGKSATLTTVIAPTDEDMHAFVSGMMTTLINRLSIGNEADVHTILDNMVKQMHMSVSETCHSTLDLSHFVANQSICDSVNVIDLDLAKALPADVVKATPELAQMPPMSTTNKQHTVITARLLP